MEYLNPKKPPEPAQRRLEKIVLVVGSAPDAMRVNGWDLGKFDAIVAINNAWRISPKWTHSIFPTDFPNALRANAGDDQFLRSANEYVPAQNKFGGFVYAGGTMAFTAAYWCLAELKPTQLCFVGCDMVYAGEKTHFYGKGKPDPLRIDPTLRNLEAKAARFEVFAYSSGCTTYNLSSLPSSRLTYQRALAPDALPSKAEFNNRYDWGKVEHAIKRERELGYFVESGKYWKEESRFDVSQIDMLDGMWLECLSSEVAI